MKAEDTVAAPEAPTPEPSAPLLPEAAAIAEQLEAAAERWNARAAAVKQAGEHPAFDALAEAVWERLLERMWPTYLDLYKRCAAAEGQTLVVSNILLRKAWKASRG